MSRSILEIPSTVGGRPRTRVVSRETYPHLRRDDNRLDTWRGYQYKAIHVFSIKRGWGVGYQAGERGRGLFYMGKTRQIRKILIANRALIPVLQFITMFFKPLTSWALLFNFFKGIVIAPSTIPVFFHSSLFLTSKWVLSSISNTDLPVCTFRSYFYPV